MTLEEKMKHVADFINLWKKLEKNQAMVGKKGYVAEEHNLCSAIVETAYGSTVLYSVSAYGQIDKHYKGLFVQNLNTKEFKDFCDSLPAFKKGRLGHHTEIQLINYIYATMIYTGIAVNRITFFSALKVCSSCFNILDNFIKVFPNLEVYEFDVRNRGLVDANLRLGDTREITICPLW